VSAAQFQQAAQAAFATWEAVPSATVAFQFGGFTNAMPSDDGDGLSVLGFESHPEMDRTLAATGFTIDIISGNITESDIFRALVEVFESRDRAVRITFSLKPGEDILPLVAEIARRRDLRVTSFMAMSHHEPPLCVVQLAGVKLEEALEDVWKSQHRVMNVVQLAAEEARALTT